MNGVSAVVPTRNEGRRVRDTVAALLKDLPANGEIVVVDDASTDGSTDRLADGDSRVRVHRCPDQIGPAAARNLGAMLTSGDLLVFVDAHVEPLGPWAAGLREAAAGPGVGAVAPVLQDWSNGGRGYGLRMIDVKTNIAWLESRGTRAYAVPLLPGFFLAVPRRVFLSVRGFDPAFAHWGMEDLDLVVRLWTLGYECVLQPSVVVRHWSKGGDPPDYQQEWPATLFNILLFGASHFGDERWRRMIDAYADEPLLPELAERLEREGHRARRASLRAVRSRDDDDLFRLCGQG